MSSFEVFDNSHCSWMDDSGLMMLVTPRRLTDKLKVIIAKLYGYDINKDRKEVIHELADFLQLDPRVVVRLLPEGTRLAAEEYRAMKNAIMDPQLFYSSSKNYLFDLCYGNYWNIGSYVGMVLRARESKGGFRLRRWHRNSVNNGVESGSQGLNLL